MGFDMEIEEYQEQLLEPKHTYKIKYTVSNGTYYANSIWGLIWEVYSHRFSHLIKHGRWMD